MSEQIDIHEAIALAAYPPVLDLFITVVFVAFGSGFGLLSRISSFALLFFLVTLIPLVPVPVYIRKGLVDFYVSDRRQRTRFYLIAIASYSVAVSLLYYFRSATLFALVLSYLLITIAAMLINLKWKISAHAAGIAGPVTAIAYVFGPQYLVLHALTITVMWSRVRAKGHSAWQVVAGAAISIAITLAAFYLVLPF